MRVAPLIACATASVAIAAASDLFDAAYRDDRAAVERLVRSGADVNAPNRYGLIPLALACANGDAAMVELLLKAGADPNGIVAGGETALMTCARAGGLEAVKLLLARGANVNAKEPKRGQTAIMWAAAEGHAAVVEALIAAGANFGKRLDTGYNAFLFAVREGRGEV